MAKTGLDVDKLVTITGEALSKTANVTGSHEPDKALRMYKSLKPEDFEILTEKFGSKVVQDYIKEHEFKIMGVD